jgi:TPP-dependent pyruvate/acetoin dehydrogenase alpha subunit
MKEIISEINSAIAQKIVEERTKNAKNETNSKVDDIYSDVYEVNNENQTTIDELY